MVIFKSQFNSDKVHHGGTERFVDLGRLIGESKAKTLHLAAGSKLLYKR